MLYEVLWKLFIILVVFVIYASLGIAISGFMAFRAVDKKREPEVSDESRNNLEKAS